MFENRRRRPMPMSMMPNCPPTKIFVGNLDPKTLPEDLAQLFRRFGVVTDSCVIKSYGFVHMATEFSAMEAKHNLNGFMFNGSRIRVEISDHGTQNRSMKGPDGGPGQFGFDSEAPVQIKVKNVNPETEQNNLKSLFEMFGEVSQCTIIHNAATVVMPNSVSAQNAVASLNNYELDESKLRVEHADPSRANANRGMDDFDIPDHARNIKIFVGNINDYTTEDDLWMVFEDYGEVTDVCIIKNYGFVRMANKFGAKRAVRGLHGFVLNGNPMNVEISVPAKQGRSKASKEHTENLAKGTKIFVGNLTDNVSSADLTNVFEEFGEVTECSILKNYGFVHMAEKSEADAAVEKLHGQLVDGCRITVDLSTTATQGRAKAKEDNSSATKIFVGNLNIRSKREDLRQLFEKHGYVTECNILKNFGFVHMPDRKEANAAIKALNGHELDGYLINVCVSSPENKGMPQLRRRAHGPAKGVKIFIGNVNEFTTESELQKLFEQHGEVAECDIIKNFAFVHMVEQAAADAAVAALSDYDLNGCKLTVQLSTPGAQGAQKAQTQQRVRGQQQNRGGMGRGGGGRFKPYGKQNNPSPGGFGQGFGMKTNQNKRGQQQYNNQSNNGQYSYGQDYPMGGYAQSSADTSMQGYGQYGQDSGYGYNQYMGANGGMNAMGMGGGMNAMQMGANGMNMGAGGMGAGSMGAGSMGAGRTAAGSTGASRMGTDGTQAGATGVGNTGTANTAASSMNPMAANANMNQYDANSYNYANNYAWNAYPNNMNNFMTGAASSTATTQASTAPVYDAAVSTNIASQATVTNTGTANFLPQEWIQAHNNIAGLQAANNTS